MKIPFDIKYRPQIESGEYKVETKDGKQVRIVSWDKEGFECQEIVALVTNATGTESCNIYTINGFLRSNYYQRNMNLFIITPEEELTDFEKCLADLVSFSIRAGLPNDGDYEAVLTSESIRFAKMYSGKLLTIAREQFIKDGYVIEKKAFHDAVEKIDNKHKAEMSIEYSLHCKVENRTRHAIMNWDTFQKVAQKFIDIGKDEALKDLPRWIPNKFDKHNFETCKAYLDTPRYLCYQDKMIDVSDLVEKLPGFKEDEK